MSSTQVDPVDHTPSDPPMHGMISAAQVNGRAFPVDGGSRSARCKRSPARTAPHRPTAARRAHCARSPVPRMRGAVASGPHRLCPACYERAQQPRAPSSVSVTWAPDLTALRLALPAGTAVGIGAQGVVVDLIGERHQFGSVDDALDWATRP
jgi:hypothetical protein